MKYLYIKQKNNGLEPWFFIALKIITITTVLLLAFSCSDEEECGYSEHSDCPELGLNVGDVCDSNGDGMTDGILNANCECIPDFVAPPGCDLETELNLSSGIDANGNVVAASLGAVDPFWKIINQPPLFGSSPGTACTNAAVGSFTGDTFAMNFSGQGPDSWVNQTGASTIAPFDLGPNGSFGCNNANNANGARVPYVFERSFCVLRDTNVDFNFTFKGDDQIFFELVDNSDNSVLSTSPLYIWATTPIQTWTATALPLPAGSYSIRGRLVNTGAVILGFSFLGDMNTTNGDEAISNNVDGCCENNVISVLNVVETDCNSMFDSTSDQLAANWTFNLLDSNNNVIRTEMSDANGNVFFSGLADGNYTVQIITEPGFTTSTVATSISVSNNQVEIQEFYNCTN